MRIDFTVISTGHGTMIVPLHDWKQLPDDKIEWGVGTALLLQGAYDPEGLPLLMAILEGRRRDYGDGVVMIDGGANIGCYCLTCARFMDGWGEILAFEPQERIFYALAGNIAMNNLMNARAYRCALGGADGSLRFPVPDYGRPGNYGGVNAAGTSEMGQEIKNWQIVPVKRIDSLLLPRLDFLKLDVEGMEIETLNGAIETIERCKPFIMAEHIKVGRHVLEQWLRPYGYATTIAGLDVLAAYGHNDIIHQIQNAHDNNVEIFDADGYFRLRRGGNGRRPPAAEL